MTKIRVAAVSYLNTKPLLYGIKRHRIIEQIELTEDYPARIAAMLADGKVDVGLIPVAATLRLPEWHIVGDYCIGAEGPVASVCLFSEVPVERIETVYLDYQSRTSVNLARLLLKEYWKKEVKLVDAGGEDYRDEIRGTTAGVVIGDRALQQRLVSPYIYDLAEAWIHHTGKPFVFAAWISTSKLPDDFVTAFNEANALGMRHLPDVIRENPVDYYDMHTYFTTNISYHLTGEKLAGMHQFLNALKHI